LIEATQTSAIRIARAALRSGEIDRGEYVKRMKAEIAAVIALQEQLGLDVLVHGEPERNDMVQYFAEHLDGVASTELAWVQSYGSRCVRPPIIHGDVSRPAPMTVDWSSYAQSLSAKPVKGMLTGPVTILAWSFVRDDQPLADTAAQVALALRDEITDLEAAGIGIVQVDEPALRELLPLRVEDQPAYLDWSVGADLGQRHAFFDRNAVVDHVQVGLLKVNDTFPAQVFHIGIFDVPFHRYRPIEDLCAGRHVMNLDRDVSF